MPTETVTEQADSDSEVAAVRGRIPDDGVEICISLGWQMAEFFREVGVYGPDPTDLPPRLPGIPDFPALQLWKLRLDQVDVAFARLGAPLRRELTGTTLGLPKTDKLRDLNPRDERSRHAVLQLHRDILDILTAANFRLGKAYGLGVALADLTLAPPADEAFFRSGFAEGSTADGIVEAFDDLKSLLPHHAAESVSGSVREWQAWMLDQPAGTGDWAPAASALKTQGKRWRAILTGEKRAVDFLGIDDYILAGEALLARFRQLTTRFLVQHWFALAMVVILTAAVVALALIYTEGATKFWSIAVWLFGTIGVSAGTTKNAVGNVAGRIGDGLWGAELDLAIIKAITTLPGNAPTSIAPPPAPMAGANRAYQKPPTGPPTRPVDMATIRDYGPQRTGHKAPRN
ncbi:MAG: hypothetical protein M3179_02685 [Actinomycetota bacterium]|nr:hypothetical protein [Actinomycetota bacterium]